MQIAYSLVVFHRVAIVKMKGICEVIGVREGNQRDEPAQHQ
jgi:hypothetical protein